MQPCPPFPDMEALLERQHDFSLRTFGPGPRAAGVVAHIRKELEEVERAPADITEWVDVMILAADGAMRAGHSPADVLAAYRAKLERNFARTWPDWRTMPADAPIEHDRSADLLPAGAVGLDVLLSAEEREADRCLDCGNPGPHLCPASEPAVLEADEVAP